MDEDARPRRMFFALWPDAESASHLAALGQELAGRHGRATHPASVHLTLAFVGATPPERVALLEEIGAKVQGEAFELSLDRLGFWPQRGILWAGCRQAPAPLRDLAGELARELSAAGFAVDQRAASALVPHVTLARRVRCASLPRLGAPIRWQVGEFALVESRLGPSGSSYTTLRGFPLDDADAG